MCILDYGITQKDENELNVWETESLVQREQV